MEAVSKSIAVYMEKIYKASDTYQYTWYLNTEFVKSWVY